MQMLSMAPSARARPSPFYDAALAEGMCQASVYNRMLLPLSYGDPEAEYDRLINGVAMWDVAAERQVEITGPDAARLAQMLTTRDLSKCQVGQGKYVALCNHDGVLINDPILLKRDEDRFWFSIADSDIWFWARAVAGERGFNVSVREPDASPLAIQGPRAEDVVADLFGDWVRSVKYFWFQEAILAGIPVLVARSGWSKQGGFEIYLLDADRGTDLWNVVKEAGAPYGIGPGNPNWMERIESGLLSWGGDTDMETNPFEVRMGKYVDLDVPDDTVGIAALRRVHEEGPKRHQLGLRLDGDTRRDNEVRWVAIERDGEAVGHMTNRAWSPRLAANIGFALVSREAKPGDRVRVTLGGEPVDGTLCEMPFL